MAEPAFAQCSTSTGGDGTVTIACGNTVTTPANNFNGNNPSTNASGQYFSAPINMTINSGTTIGGWGLYLGRSTQLPSGTPQPISVVNNGTISHTAAWASVDQGDDGFGLVLNSNSGSVSYSGNGTVTTNATGDAAVALTLIASGQGHQVSFGSQAAPVTGTFSGEEGIRLASLDSGTNAWFAGGTITATQAVNGRTALSVTGSSGVNLTMTGHTVVNGGIAAGLQIGAGFSPASAVTVSTDAQITNNDLSGAGLAVSSRDGGADVTLTSGASINVANVGVSLVPTTGQSRFTTAASTAINQTGTTGANRIGLWFTPAGTGSLVADLSGSIAATGTGILLQPVNGNASVTIRAGGSISGGAAGIQVTQAAGATGLVDIRNAGTLTGAAAVTATPAGTAFTLTNSGTMTGTVNVTGSSVAGSFFTNSGTWNTGGGNSSFAGSLTNSGTINANNGVIETLTIEGNLVLNAGSSYRLDVGNGVADRINVAGTATLAGSLAAFATGSVFTSGTYTLLNAAGGVSGTFSPLTTTPSSGSQLRYDANNVYLEVGPGISETFSSRESLVFNAPAVTTNRVNIYSTQIIGRLLGGQPLYDQTFAAAYDSPAVQGALMAARAAITTAGGPGVVIGDPVRTSSSTTSSTSSVSTFSLAGPRVEVTPEVVVTFGPATIQIGALSTCNVASLPSATRPSCTVGGTGYQVGDNETNFNTIQNFVYTVNETRTDTITDTLRETWELNGQVVAVGTIHAEVQSGVLDLGSRLLGRLTAVRTGNAGWAEGYRFRVSQSGRRDAWGLAGGFGVAVAPGVTLGLGVDHGRLDIDVPDAREDGDVELTELGAVLRIERGPFTASLALVHGFGKAETLRTIIGASRADYEVRVSGGAMDLGYAFRAGGWTIRPVAGLDYLHLATDAFAETDTLGLIAAKQRVDRVRASAGVEIDRDLGGIALGGSLRYLTVLDGGARGLPVAFALAPGQVLDMTVPGEPDTLMAGARASIPVAAQVALTLSWAGRFGAGYENHVATAGLRVTF